MEIKLLKRYDSGWYIAYFRSKYFQFRWFTDCGYKFLYIHFGKRFFRFSDAGFISGVCNFQGEMITKQEYYS